MSEQPYMQLWIADYLGDTQHLTAEQSGCYLHLLMCMWRAGGFLPNDDTKLARVARVTLKRWLKIGPDVMEFFDVDEEFITQKRLLLELQKARSKSQSRSDAGRAGAEAKALKNKRRPQAKATANEQAKVQHSPKPESLATNVAKREDRAKRGSILPDDWTPTHADVAWADERGYPLDWQRDQLEAMRLWAQANANRAVARKADWSATWRNWLKRAWAERRGPGPPRVSRTTQAGLDLMEEIQSGKFNGTGESRVRDEGCERAPRQLSQPAARSGDIFEATDDCLHGEAEGDAAKDG